MRFLFSFHCNWIFVFVFVFGVRKFPVPRDVDEYNDQKLEIVYLKKCNDKYTIYLLP